MAQFGQRPADKVYTAANGHVMEVAPQYSNNSGWHFVYAFAGHSDSCPCWNSEDGGYNVSEYAGEEE